MVNLSSHSCNISFELFQIKMSSSSLMSVYATKSAPPNNAGHDIIVNISDKDVSHNGPSERSESPSANDGQSKRRKAEVPNPYLQFMMERKGQLRLQDPQKKLDMQKVKEDWRNLSEDKRNIYKQRTLMEREILGIPCGKKKVKNPKKIRVNQTELKTNMTRGFEGKKVLEDEPVIIDALLNVELRKDFSYD